MIPTFIINLKRNTDRKSRLLEQIDRLNLTSVLDIIWFDAVDGRLLSSDPNPGFKVNELWYEPTHKKPMTCGEVGCSMSHWRIWEAIVEKKYDVALILEDDVKFSDAFAEKIRSYVDYLPVATDMAYIHRKALNVGSEVVFDDRWIVARTSYWACAYMLTQTGATKLLNTSYTKSLTPVDEFLPFVYDLSYRQYVGARCPLEYVYPDTFNTYALREVGGIDLDDSISFIMSDTYHSPSFMPIQTKLRAITICHTPNAPSSMARWKYSCETYGIPYTVLTADLTGNIFETLGKITDLDSIDADYIFYTDYMSTFVLGNPLEILDKYRLAIRSDESKILCPSIKGSVDKQSGFVGKKSVVLDLIRGAITQSNTIVADSGCQVFQHLNNYANNSFFKTDRAVFSNTLTKTTPSVLCSGPSSKLYFNSLENYTLYGHKQQYGFKLGGLRSTLPKIDVYCFFMEGLSVDFIRELAQLDYPADLLTVHIVNVREKGRGILDDKFTVKYVPMSTTDGYAHMMESAANTTAEYVWILYEGYNIATPAILTDALKADRDIVAPLFKRNGTLFSNFWGALGDDGFYKRSDDYMDILNLKKKSLWNVPYVHGNILFKTNVLRRNPDLFTKNPNIDTDMLICRNLRDANELIYLLNTETYGAISDEINTDSIVTLTATPAHPQWTMDEYLHPDFYEFLFGNKTYGNPRDPESNSIFKQVSPDVWQFPTFTEAFCDALIAEADKFGTWSPGNDTTADPRITGGHENYPTQDIHLTQLGLTNFWKNTVVEIFFKKVMSHLYAYKTKSYNISFIVRYKFGEQTKLSPHHDASVYTTNTALNTQDVDYEGGGCRFVFSDVTITHTKKGYTNLHPGRLSHYHEGLQITSGTRYILVSFNE